MILKETQLVKCGLGIYGEEISTLQWAGAPMSLTFIPEHAPNQRVYMFMSERRMIDGEVVGWDYRPCGNAGHGLAGTESPNIKITIWND